MVPLAGRPGAEMTKLLPDSIAPPVGANVGVGHGCRVAVPEAPLLPLIEPLAEPLTLPLLPPVLLPLLPVVLLPLLTLPLLPPHPTTAPSVSSVALTRTAARIMLRPPIVRPMVVPFFHDSAYAL